MENQKINVYIFEVGQTALSARILKMAQFLELIFLTMKLVFPPA